MGLLTKKHVTITRWSKLKLILPAIKLTELRPFVDKGGNVQLLVEGGTVTVFK